MTAHQSFRLRGQPMTTTQYADTLARLATNRDMAQERAMCAETAEERRDAARTVACLEDDIRALRAMCAAPEGAHHV